MECTSPATFASPITDQLDRKLDLNQMIIKHPAATFFVRAQGTSGDLGIQAGDLLVIDRAATVSTTVLALCVIEGAFAVRKVRKENQQLLLLGQKSTEAPTLVTQEMDFELWGVVTFVIRELP